MGRIEDIEALLRQSEQAHGIYEATVLNGVYDQEWPRWYAAYAVDHGIGEMVDHPVDVDHLAQFLATSWNDFEREAPMPTDPWATYTARRIAAET